MPTISELEAIIVEKDDTIRKLELRLKNHEDSIAELRSQLDKFQSVMPFATAAAAVNKRARKERAQGISAEPQSLRTIQELSLASQKTVPDFPKSSR
ncbi:hypothetical protein HAZT_HAZT008626 [Hyalella azteca]|uniref:Uncharacterized protein n=1 Tax=Hyalella azteca TaxID=294128 RepID=A0A6A0HGB7_HYAAZ|nr:hypothetical protein HAZT_HAZT008626 [Hyalella azteca]